MDDVGNAGNILTQNIWQIRFVRVLLLPPPHKTNNMTKGNYPINPIPDLNSHPSDWYGLTKREYFAAMAMQGIVADPNGYIMAADIAKGAVEIADALIEQLNK